MRGLFLTLVWLQRADLCQISVVTVTDARVLYRKLGSLLSSQSHFQYSSFLWDIWISISHYFPSSWGAAFNILLPGLMVVTSFIFVWLKKSLFSFWFLRYFFFVYRVLGNRFSICFAIPFNTFPGLFFSDFRHVSTWTKVHVHRWI